MSTPTSLSPPAAELDAELQAERIRLHVRVLGASMGASAIMGCGLVALLWPHANQTSLLWWLASLAGAMVFRWTLARRWRQADQATAVSRQLWSYRAGFVLHGLVWALACVLLMPGSEPRQFQLLAYATMAVTTGSLILTAFDLAAAGVFVLPALTSLVWLVASRTDVDRLGLLLEMLVLHVAGLLVALRARTVAVDGVRLRWIQVRLVEEARQQAEQASAARRELAERNYLFPLVLNTTEQGYWFVDADGLTRDVNPAMCSLLGRTREELLGRRFEDLLCGADLEAVRALHAGLHERGTGGIELGIGRSDGSRRHCLVHATRVQDPQGHGVGAVGLWSDITARREAELSLSTYALAINSINDMVSVVDEDQKYRMVNDAWCRLSGLRRADVLGQPASVAMPAGISPKRRFALQECFDQQTTRTVRDGLSLPGLQDRVVETTYYPYVSQGEGQRSVVMVTRDVTAEQRSLETAREREAEQRAVLDAFPGFITRVDEHLVYTYANQRVAARLGTTVEQMIGRTLPAVTGAEVGALLMEHIGRALDGESVTYERHHARADGEDLYDQVTLVRGEDPHTGRPIVYSFGVDITDRKRAEGLLRATTDQLSQATVALQLTLDNIAQGIVSMDADGRIGVYNKRVLELLELPEHLMGPDWRYDDIVRYQREQGELMEDHGFIDAEGQRRYFAGGRVNSPEVYVRRTRQGTVLEVRTRQLQGGGLVRTFSDVTAYFDAQQALRDSEAELRTLLDAFPGHIAAARQDAVFSYVNERHAAVLGLPMDAIVGRSLREVLGEERMRFNETLALRARDEGAVVQELSYPATDGRARMDLEVTYVAGPVRKDGRCTYYAFGVDITARKRAEEALVAARDLSESASRAKSEFLASMSHELRTPLNAILGFSQLFAMDQGLPAATRAGAAEIENAGRHLLALVDDLIDLARIEAGRLDLRLAPVPLRPVLDASVDMVQPLLRKQGIVLHVIPGGEGLVVRADTVRLRQVFINLLSNAIKYNRPQGTVHITCTAEDGHVHVSVADTGWGIAADKRERIFSSFDRLGAERGRVEGAGIGLVITRRIVEAMGGEIGFDSTQGIGSVFWVRLARVVPVVADAGRSLPASAVIASPPPHADGSLSAPRHRVLYVEDNLVNATIMEHLLGRLPQVEFRLAETAEEGLALIFSDPPSLVLMDIHLPGMSGIDAVRILRRDARTATLPVIAVSAAAMPADVSNGLEAGFDAYLTKPFNVEQLLQAVSRTLGL
jgi:PAS domain S-box-containing protein